MKSESITARLGGALENHTIPDLQAKMASGELTARALTEYYLQRIETIDQHGPTINAVVELNPEALAQANERDAERQTRGPRSALHGIPVTLKDNIDTHDKMMTTAGSLALVGSIAAQDAFLVKQLRQAGAVILGKTNLSEWANFRSVASTSGWSSRGGQTRNPYALDRNPSGSSSGSAAAVAADLCTVAVGTETDGSIISPSNANGIVGIKPTLGLISRVGIIPIASSQDTAGPMARTVTDAAILLGILAAVDPDDPATLQSQGKAFTDYTQFLDRDGLRRARIGIARNNFGVNPKVEPILNGCIAVMRQSGAEIIDPANIENLDELGKTEMEVLLYEFKVGLNNYLARRDALPVHSLDELIAFNEAHQDRVLPYFGQDLLIKAANGPSEEAYRAALETNHRLARTEGIDATLQKYKLDAIVAPSGGPAWLIDWVNGDHFTGGSSSPAAVAGYPSVTVPAGYVTGLPVGISFIGGAYQEPTLIRLAYAFEQATLVRRPPQFLPGVQH